MMLLIDPLKKPYRTLVDPFKEPFKEPCLLGSMIRQGPDIESRCLSSALLPFFFLAYQNNSRKKATLIIKRLQP